MPFFCLRECYYSRRGNFCSIYNNILLSLYNWLTSRSHQFTLADCRLRIQATTTMQICQMYPLHGGPLPILIPNQPELQKRHKKKSESQGVKRKFQCAYHGLHNFAFIREHPGLTNSSPGRETIPSAHQHPPLPARADLLLRASSGPARALCIPVRGVGREPCAGASDGSSMAGGPTDLLCDTMSPAGWDGIHRSWRWS